MIDMGFLLRKLVGYHAKRRINKLVEPQASVVSERTSKSQNTDIIDIEDGEGKSNARVRGNGRIEYIPPVGNTQDEILLYLKNHPNNITFIHGKAGCGKTYIVNKAIRDIGTCQVLTPTNLAASLYPNATTIHSFFYGALDSLEEGYQNPKTLNPIKCSRLAAKLRTISFLFIDEISMVRSDLFEMINQICQFALRNKQPFGGIKVILVGDLFQLPPIVSDEAVLEYLQEEYGGIYFFNSHVIRDSIKNIKLFELTQSYRHQQDSSFEKILDEFRAPIGGRRKIELLNAINSRVTDVLPADAIYIASSNDEVRKINEEKLSSIPGQEKIIESVYKILREDGAGHVTVKHSGLSQVDNVHTIVLPSQYDSILRIKKGARVTLTKSSKYWGYCNGDFGTVEEYEGESIRIKIDRTGKSVLCPHPSDRYKENQMNEYRYEMEYDSSSHKLVRKRPFIQKTTQYPVKLAYAFTIRKSQGQTYDKIIVDLNSHIFAPGQLYVALSRAKSLQGLFLTKPVAYSDIISDDAIFEFLSEIRHLNRHERHSSASDRNDESRIVVNPVCANFINFIRNNETQSSYREFMQHILRSYDTLLDQCEYEKAHWELQKVVNLIVSTYQAEDYSQLLECIRVKPSDGKSSQYALNAIFEIYTDIVKCPRKRYLTEEKTIICKL